MDEYMRNYSDLVSALAGELASVEQILNSLNRAEWSKPTLLAPVEPVPPWTVLELAGHLGYAMSMIDTHLSNGFGTPAALDRVSFYDQPPGLLAPLAYRTAADAAAGKTGTDVLDFCSTSFASGVTGARLAHPAFVGWTVIGTIRIDEFIATRVVEAVVHGLDLAQALNRAATPSAAAVDYTAQVMDLLNKRRYARDRPQSLADNWLWVQVATGRRSHADFPEPLLA